MKYWGYHLILDCKNGELKKVKSADAIKNFVEELVEKIDMVASGEPNIKHFATHNKDAAGYSLVQLIETSSITGHFVDKNGDCYIEVAKSVVNKHFSPIQIKVTYLTRQA